MEADRVILGSGITIAAITGINGAISGNFQPRVLIGSLVASLLLSALAAAGLGQIARGLALLALIAVVLSDGVRVIETVANL